VAITLSATDAETAAADLTFTVTSLPAHGTLYFGTTIVSVGHTFTGSPTVLTYVSGIGCEATSDSFTFSVTDKVESGGCSCCGESAPITVNSTVSIAIVPAVADGAITSSGGIVRIGGTAGNDTIVLTDVGGVLHKNGASTGISLGGVTEIRVWG